MESKNLKILIIRLSALGDTIHTLPLAYALRKKFPEAKIDWVVEDKASVFVIDNPLINCVYEIPKTVWKKRWNKFQNLKEFIEIISKIRKEKYDIVIDTQQLFKSGILLGLSAGKRKITLDGGREFSFLFADEIIKTGMKQFDINYHVVNRNLKIAQYLGCETENPVFVIPDYSDKYSKDIINIMESIDKTKKTIVIAPATTWLNKHWNYLNWVRVINEFKNEYNIIITAGDKERKLTSKIMECIPDKSNIIDLTGLTEIQDLIYIYKNSDVVITPDSGSCHMAWASFKPYILSLFFSTSAKRTAPFGDKYISLQAKISCSPCMKKKCGRKSDANACSNKINSVDVINILKKVLQEN